MELFSRRKYDTTIDLPIQLKARSCFSYSKIFVIIKIISSFQKVFGTLAHPSPRLLPGVRFARQIMPNSIIFVFQIWRRGQVTNFFVPTKKDSFLNWYSREACWPQFFCPNDDCPIKASLGMLVLSTAVLIAYTVPTGFRNFPVYKRP